jgi:hypothetical protein
MAVEAVAADGPEDHERPEPLRDDVELSRAMRRLRRAQAEVDRIGAVAQAEVEDIAAWQMRESRRPADEVAYWSGLIERYALAAREANPRLKTLSTPHGTVSTRAGSESWKVTDPAALTAWAEVHAPGLLRREVTVKVADLRGQFTAASGEAFDGAGNPIPGVQVVTAPMSVHVTPAAGPAVDATDVPAPREAGDPS